MAERRGRREGGPAPRWQGGPRDGSPRRRLAEEEEGEAGEEEEAGGGATVVSVAAGGGGVAGVRPPRPYITGMTRRVTETVT